MTEIEHILLLKNQIPIRLNQPPYCKKCMNQIVESEEYCKSCLEPPFQSNEDWYFNKVISLGLYKTYENDPYNNIPLNILTKLILIIKSEIKKPKKKVGNYIANGLFQMVIKYPFLLNEKTIVLIPPKYDSTEENQCTYFLKPFISILEMNGFQIYDISDKILRIKDISVTRGKNRETRFKDIKNAHRLNPIDLQNQKVLILDDVVTSCSTIWDISRELKEKNAGEINVLSIGRTLMSSSNIMSEDIHHDLDFNELITYFSNLDNYLDPNKIHELKLNDINIEERLIESSIKSYKIAIDYKNLTLKHNCRDFEIKRMMNKNFCKHISKVFYEVKELRGENFARSKLNAIYKDLIDWKFIVN